MSVENRNYKKKKKKDDSPQLQKRSITCCKQALKYCTKIRLNCSFKKHF